MRSTDQSAEAANVAAETYCPTLRRDCNKQGKTGVCSIQTTQSLELVPVCPSRLYFDEHLFLRRIASDVFGDLNVATNPADLLPTLMPWNAAKAAAAASGLTQVGVFGAKPFEGELNLPVAIEGAGSPKVDFTVFAVSPGGDLLRFVPVEVQSIDTTNSTRDSQTALKNGRQVVQSGVGLNWENVNKRILPQLIVKGLMLQAESKCTHGLYFVTPEAVYKKIMLRLGGTEADGMPRRLRSIPQQPGSLTFHRYDYDLSVPLADGVPTPMALLDPVTVSTSDLSLAFITPENLPASGAYETAMRNKLGV